MFVIENETKEYAPPQGTNITDGVPVPGPVGSKTINSLSKTTLIEILGYEFIKYTHTTFL